MPYIQVRVDVSGMPHTFLAVRSDSGTINAWGFAPESAGSPVGKGLVEPDTNHQYNQEYSSDWAYISDKQANALNEWIQKTWSNPPIYDVTAGGIIPSIYDPMNCTEWVNRGLKYAGITNPFKTGFPTPYNQALERWLKELFPYLQDRWNQDADPSTGMPWPTVDPLTNSYYFSAVTWRPRDPLAVDLTGDGIKTVAINPNAPILFDHNGDGAKSATGWLEGSDAWLVRDINGNGSIDSGVELFGVDTDITVNSVTRKATNGFEALAALDANSDKLFNANDTAFTQVRLWQDLNQNGVSDAGELSTLADKGITSIALNFTSTNTNLGNGNTVTGKAVVTRTTGTSEIDSVSVASDSAAYNLNLADNPFYSSFTPIALTSTAATQPEMHGSGAVRDLREAMSLGTSQATALATSITRFAAATSRDAQMALLDQVVQQWGATSALATSSPFVPGAADEFTLSNPNDPLGQNIQTFAKQNPALYHKIIALEQFNGAIGLTQLISRWGISLPNQAVSSMESAYSALRDSIYGALALQTRLKPYIDLVNVVVDTNGVHFENSALTAKFEDYKSANPENALKDLVDLNRYAQSALNMVGWDALGKLSSWVESLAVASPLRATLTTLGVFTASTASASATNDIYLGDATANIFNGRDGDDLLAGSEGIDELHGGAGNDVLEGGAGNDLLDGGAGDDTYWFGLGDGTDVLHEGARSEPTDSGGRDILRIRGDISPQSIKITREHTDIILTLPGHIENQTYITDSIRLQNALDNDGFNTFSVENIAFGNGETWSIDNIKSRLLTGSDDNDVVEGYATSDDLHGNGGDDTLIGNDGADNLFGDAGQDKLYGGNGDDYLDGGAGNDILSGGSGENFYMLKIGSGQDIVERTYDDLVSALDTVLIPQSVGLDNIEVKRTNYSDLIFRIKGTQDSICFKNVLLNDGNHANYSLQYGFAGGDPIGWSAFRSDLLHGSSDNDALDGFATDDVLVGGAGEDTLRGFRGNDSLDGGLGADNLSGGDGDDTLDGGGGDDDLVNDLGADVYLFGAGDGQDTIDDSNPDNSVNTLRFKAGVLPEALTLSSTWNSLIIKINNDDQVFVQGFLRESDPYNNQNPLQRIQFNDKTTWEIPDILEELFGGSAQADSIVGTGNADLISGLDGADTLWGVNGADTIYGNDGDDYIIGGETGSTLDGGTGRDEIHGSYGSDLMIGGSDDDLLIDFSFGQNTIEGGLGNDTIFGGRESDTLRGGDSNDRICGDRGADLLEGGSGNDFLDGAGEFGAIWGPDSSDDTLDGGLGDDTLDGSGGNDTFLFGRGDGQDYISDVRFSTDTRFSTLAFKEGIGRSEVAAYRSGDDLIVTIINSSDKVVVENFFYKDSPANAYNPIQQITFAHDAPWDVGAILKNVADNAVAPNSAAKIYGPTGANSIDGGDGDDTIIGGPGNDFIRGYSGCDKIIGGPDSDKLYGWDDDDTLDGGTGTDTVNGGYGNDTYIFGKGDGRDLIGDSDDDNPDKLNTLLFRSDVTASEVSLSQSGDELWVSTLNATDLIRVESFFFENNIRNSLNPVQQISFADGSVWSLDSISNFMGAIRRSGAGTFSGSATADRLYSLSEGDALSGFAGADFLFAGDGNDLLDGGTENDLLYGEAGSDTLTGGQGADTMIGGMNDDFYYVDDVDDIVIEQAAIDDFNSYDQIESSVSYTAPDNVEAITLTGATDINATANNNGCDINGNAGNNYLKGGDGLDFIFGDEGVDTLDGGAGDDYYYLTSNEDTVIEQAGGGLDQIWAYGDGIRMADNVERLYMQSYLARTAYGNNGNNVMGGNNRANTLYGNGGNDRLFGYNGDDTLYGGQGNDNLYGSVGNDVYHVQRGDGQDLISDFDMAVGAKDRLVFDGAVDSSQLWLTRSGNDLVLSIIGTSDKVTVSSWYVGSESKVESITAAGNGKTLDYTKVDALVNAMAGFTPPAAGQTTLPQAYQDQLAGVIAANWV